MTALADVVDEQAPLAEEIRHYIRVHGPQFMRAMLNETDRVNARLRDVERELDVARRRLRDERGTPG